MKTHLYTYLTLLPQFLILLPSALLCYLPMKDQLRFSPHKTMFLCLAVFIPYAALAAGLCLVTGVDMNQILIPSFVLFFLFYKKTITVNFSCALSIFVGVCTLMTFPSQFSYGLDSCLYPNSGAANFSVWAALFQLVLSCLLTAFLSVPCAKLYPKMVAQLPAPQIWLPLLAIHGLLFLFNMMMIPYSYPTLHTGRAFSMFLVLEFLLLLLFLLLHVIFYHMADVILEHAELEERSRFLEMQAGQYRTLQNYMHQTRRLRHDFRQSVHILSALARDENLAGLKAHLQEYEQQWNTDVPVSYCTNAALNALFNYYKEMADAQAIQTDWQLSLPEPLTVSELDLSSLFGNLMENAISGCMTLPPKERYFALSVEVRQENCLYIVSTNSFDGQAQKKGNAYLSTKQTGQGIGLFSITSIAKKYHGDARFINIGKEFYVDVMLKI